MFKKSNKKRVLTWLFLILMALVLVLSSTSLGFAQPDGFNADGATAVSSFTNSVDKGTPGVNLPGAAPNSFVPSPEIDPLQPISVIVVFDDSADSGAIEAATGGTIVHRYTRVFNGVSIVMPAGQVEKLGAMQGVVAFYEDKLMQPDTDTGPQWIGAPTVWDELGGQGMAGEGIIVGVLDTGIWPEHPSFADPDPNGNPYSAPGGTYDCDLGSVQADGDDLGLSFACNNKLIGAYRFMDTYEAFNTLLDDEFTSARDDNGHGTHTSSTAAGNGNVSAEVLGVDRGLISGVAPRAHVIMYKVCGEEGCYSSDSAAAVEQAIIDGADVINFSISGGSNPYSDAVELAFSEAYDNGVFVSASAGNNGPGADTVAHRGPWTMTVGASTHDRTIAATLMLEADGDDLTVDGVSITGGYTGPVVIAADFDGLPDTDPEDGMCNTPFPAGTWTNGEIVICKRGIIARVTKSFNVAEGGAGGFVLYNPTVNSLASDSHWIPGIHIDDVAGVAVLDFMDTHTDVTGTLSGGINTAGQGDVMAAFSSRGGSNQTLGISKPDVSAPGVQILAGDTPYPAVVLGQPGLFAYLNGTSMSSPHDAGAAALLKALHPDWTPGEIKSALMTTATVENLVKEDGVTPVDHYDAGSGRIDLTKAGDPGLTISDSTASYMAHENDLWNSNYPSLYIPNMPGQMTVQRTAQSQLDWDAWWATSVDSPDDLIITVKPLIGIRAGGQKTFDIQVDASLVPVGETRFATLYLEHGDYLARFPITIVRGQSDINIDKSCDASILAPGEVTDCTITLSNTSFDDASFDLVDVLPRSLRLVNGSVVGGTQVHSRILVADGTLAGAEPPEVSVGVGASPAGYLPLALLGAPPNVTHSDESIVNFTTPPFVFAGETYTTIGMVSNGYAVVGGGTGADVDFINQILPDPVAPNNVIAPFWTDLNPSDGGNYYAYTLTDSGSGFQWLVLEWEDSPNWGDGELNSFQIWVGLNGVEDISFTYGSTLSDGDGGFLTVGAENAFGNSGENYYADGVGTLPAFGTDVVVTSVPGAPGETHTVTFSMYGNTEGPWTNCAEMTSDAFDGVAASCFSGEIVDPGAIPE